MIHSHFNLKITQNNVDIFLSNNCYAVCTKTKPFRFQNDTDIFMKTNINSTKHSSFDIVRCSRWEASWRIVGTPWFLLSADESVSGLVDGTSLAQTCGWMVVSSLNTSKMYVLLFFFTVLL